jgi:hypothetical protein
MNSWLSAIGSWFLAAPVQVKEEDGRRQAENWNDLAMLMTARMQR